MLPGTAANPCCFRPPQSPLVLLSCRLARHISLSYSSAGVSHIALCLGIHTELGAMSRSWWQTPSVAAINASAPAAAAYNFSINLTSIFSLPSRFMARMHTIDEIIHLDAAQRRSEWQQANALEPSTPSPSNFAPLPGPWGFMTSGYLLGLIIMVSSAREYYMGACLFVDAGCRVQSHTEHSLALQEPISIPLSSSRPLSDVHCSCAMVLCIPSRSIFDDLPNHASYPDALFSGQGSVPLVCRTAAGVWISVVGRLWVATNCDQLRRRTRDGGYMLADFWRSVRCHHRRRVQSRTRRSIGECHTI